MRVLNTIKDARKYRKPYSDSRSSKACITAEFTPAAGSSTTLASLTVQPQKVKLRDADGVSSWVVHVTYTAPNQAPLQLAAQASNALYKTGVVNTLPRGASRSILQRGPWRHPSSQGRPRRDRLSRVTAATSWKRQRRWR